MTYLVNLFHQLKLILLAFLTSGIQKEKAKEIKGKKDRNFLVK